MSFLMHYSVCAYFLPLFSTPASYYSPNTYFCTDIPKNSLEPCPFTPQYVVPAFPFATHGTNPLHIISPNLFHLQTPIFHHVIPLLYVILYIPPFLCCFLTCLTMWMDFSLLWLLYYAFLYHIFYLFLPRHSYHYASHTPKYPPCPAVFSSFLCSVCTLTDLSHLFLTISIIFLFSL